jgi:hypothetical protein
MDLAAFVEQFDRPDVSIGVVTNHASEQYQSLLAETFGRQSVTVQGPDIVPDDVSPATDMIYLLDNEEVIAASPLEDVADSILLVNSDLYITGMRSPEEVGLPDVITALDEMYFRLRGYPESHREKLLLITISRYIERIALERGSGKLRASFQNLSRIDDERGTKTVYERLADSGSNVHVYGIPDWTPPPDYDITIHGGWGPDFRDSWFVVYVPDSPEATHAALLAIDDGTGEWHGFWTYDADTVCDLNGYIEREL